MIRLTVVRKDMGVTQKQIAKITGINHSIISRIEKEWIIPCPEWKRKISTALNYPDIDRLFEGIN